MIHRFMLYRNRARSITPALREFQAFLLAYFAHTGTRHVEDVFTPRWPRR
jgi:hypothetical protein